MSPLAAMPAIAPALGSPRVASGRAARPARASPVAVASLPARERVASLSAAVAVALSLGAPPSALAKLVNVTVDPATLTTRVCADPRAGGVHGVLGVLLLLLGFALVRRANGLHAEENQQRGG